MKQLVFASIVILSITGLSYSIVGKDDIKTESSHLKHTRNTSSIYFIDLPNGLDTIDFKATIHLDKTKNVHLIKLPNGGTGTTVSIYDHSYLNQSKSSTTLKPTPLANGSFDLGSEVLLDITSLKKDRYYVHYSSCNLGGVFSLTIN